MSLKSLQSKIGVAADGAWGPGTFRAAMSYYKFTGTQAAHFFAQTAHETGGFAKFTENLNYSAQGLRGIFGKYFADDSIAKLYERQPEKIANRVYASRMGNGPESSGDGWKYRGRGALQLTGKTNYEAFAKYLGKPEIVTNPDLVATEYAFESAKFFFDNNKLWVLCDKIDDAAILAVTKKVNGGTHGLADRSEKTKKYFTWVAVGTSGIVVPPPPNLVPKPAAPAPAPSGAVKPGMLSEHFSLKEMIKSETATRKGIDNSPSPDHLANLMEVCKHILEPVRKHFNKPVQINSAYRGPKLNAAVGGSAKSQHVNGQAVDFEIDGLANPELAKWVSENCDFDQLILEFYNPKEGPNSGWVHASYAGPGKNRKQILTAVMVNGRTVYKPGFVV
jgi:putative chitinase